MDLLLINKCHFHFSPSIQSRNLILFQRNFKCDLIGWSRVLDIFFFFFFLKRESKTNRKTNNEKIDHILIGLFLVGC